MLMFAAYARMLVEIHWYRVIDFCRCPGSRITDSLTVVAGYRSWPDESETRLRLEDVIVLYVVGFSLSRQTVLAGVRIELTAMMLQIMGELVNQ